MKEIVKWKGERNEIEYFDSTEISLLNNITQIYGFLFDSKGKFCIVRPTEARGWRLPGGGIEEGEDWKQALIREAEEEADVELDESSLKLTGYIKVTPLDKDSKKGVHYLLRAKGNITKVNDQTEDVAEGLINEREFIDSEKFLEYCPWGEIGRLQLEGTFK